MKPTKLFLSVICVFAAGTAFAADSSETIDKIRDTNEIVFGYREDAMPFAYIDNDQNPVGFSIDICNALVEDLQEKLDLKDLKVSYQPVTASNRIPLLVNGSIDVECGSTTNTDERQKAVDFLYTTYVTGTKILVRTDSGIDDLDDLKGKTIAVTSGTNNIRAVQKAGEENDLDLKLVHGDSHAVNFLQLQNKRVDGFSTDDILLSVQRAQSKSPDDYKLVGPMLSIEPYSLMVRKDDPQFKEMADESLKKIYDNGDFVEIYNKWFTEPIPPKGINLDMPMSDELKELLKNPNDSVDPRAS